MNRIRLLLLISLYPPALLAAPLRLEKGDHVCLVGNTLAERMQHHGWLETLIQSRFPRHELVFRNLGFSGDEVTTRQRSEGFGSPDDHLRTNRADVVLAFFGYNESFGGPEGLEKFSKDLDGYVAHLQGEKFNEKSPPRVVLFSPIGHEDLHDRNLPDGSGNNRNLELYTAAGAKVAAARGVLFVDLYHPSLELYRGSARPLTVNGVHLSEYGDRLLAPVIERALFPGEAAPERDATQLERIHAAVVEKDFYFFERHRTVDGYSIYGGRADLRFVDGQTNREVMQRELQILDAMAANRDRVIWSAAAGGELKADDRNTPEFVPVKTNLPGKGPGGAHVFLGGEEAIAKMKPGTGLKVELFASEEQFPDLAKPVQMAFDTRGRLWVAVWPSYPHWKPKDAMDDKLLVLEDTDGDGKADRCRTFAGGLNCPTGLEFYSGGVLVGQPPYLMFLKDTDGDGVADYRERLVGGVDSADTHHSMNSFVLDPGGALYFQEGTFHHTQVETPYGPPERCANAGVYRYEPRTQKFETYVSYSFANPHGHVFDRWGTDFVTDGTGNVNYYAVPFSGRIEHPRKHPGMEPFFQQWVRPCAGTEILSSRNFPKEMQGNFLDANVIGFLGILQYRFEEKDSGYAGVEVEHLVQSSDPNFRPVDVEVGPDGAVYFLDWQNPIIGHMQHNLRDPSRDHSHGRVYRIRSADRPLEKPIAIAGEPIEKLLDLLKEPEDRVRARVRIELGGRESDRVIAAVEKWLAALDRKDPEFEHHRLEALWVCQQHHRIGEAFGQGLLGEVLRSPSYRARAAATRVLCYERDAVKSPLDLLAVQARDEHPRVRIEAVRAASFFHEARAAEAALLALRMPMDYYLHYALKETLAQLAPLWRRAIAEGTPFAADNPAGIDYLLEQVGIAELVKLPRTRAVYQALLSREGILHEQRHEALAGLAKIDRTDETTELLQAMERLDRSESAESERVLSDLAHLLTGQSAAELRRVRAGLAVLAAKGVRPIARRIALVALVVADGGVDAVWREAEKSPASLRALLEAVPFFPEASLRAAAHPRIRPLVARPSAAADRHGEARGRYVRIELPRRGTLTLAEVRVLSGGKNLATGGKASQSSVAFGGAASRAIDGNTSGSYGDGGETHTREEEDHPWWELDLRGEHPVEAVEVWNRSEGNGAFAKRLDGFRLALLDASRREVFVREGIPAPAESARIEVQDSGANAVRRAAMAAIVTTGFEEETTFRTLARAIREGDERDAALGSIGRIPAARWPRDEIPGLIDAIVKHVGSLSTGERTSAAAKNALQLGGDLAALLGAEAGKAARRALRELGVPVIVVRPVPNLMIFDRTHLYVEAGKPVEIVLENTDIMPHNLVVAKPRTLEKVGMEAEKMVSDPRAFQRSFVPSMPEVLHATKLLQPGQSGRIDFTAPAQPGDHPFLCTFPGHWRRMFGTMHVVRSLDDVPAEQLVAAAAPAAGAVRQFVRDWKISELEGQLPHLAQGRDAARGAKLFGELVCTQCHKLAGAGADVGPDLGLVKGKLADGKMKLIDVLTSLIEPSKTIDEKFRPYVFILKDGTFVSGIIAEKTAAEVKVKVNPLEQKSGEPLAIPLAKIQESVPSDISLMPMGLLNTLNEGEILDLISHVVTAGGK